MLSIIFTQLYGTRKYSELLLIYFKVFQPQGINNKIIVFQEIMFNYYSFISAFTNHKHVAIKNCVRSHVELLFIHAQWIDNRTDMQVGMLNKLFLHVNIFQSQHITIEELLCKNAYWIIIHSLHCLPTKSKLQQKNCCARRHVKLLFIPFNVYRPQGSINRRTCSN